MASTEPIPRYDLNFLPSYIIVSPGDSLVPANKEPNITESAPAAIAFGISPVYRIPPSAMTGTPLPFIAAATSKTAEN